MRIISFLAENFMRLSVVQITPEGNLIQITGANGQGKTSTLDAIWAALGGKDAVPEEPIKAGKKAARIEVKLGDDDGLKLTVERTFTEKGTYLTVKSPDGGKFAKPQQIMDGLMGAIGFDPLQFMGMDAKQQFATIRNIVPLAVDMDAMDRRRATIFEARTALNRAITSARARVAAITFPDDLPDVAPDRQAIIARLSSASQHNAAIDAMEREEEAINARCAELHTHLNHLQEQVKTAAAACETAMAEHTRIYQRVHPDRIDVTKVRADLEAADALAEGFRLRQAKIEAEGELTTLTREEEEKTGMIAEIDRLKAEAITKVPMPVEGLAFHVPAGESFSQGTVTYKGHPLRQASGAEQLAVSAAIGAALNPKLKVLLCRDGSLLDSKSLTALSAFAEKTGIQVFLERVDESGEIGVVIEDGHVKGQEAMVEQFLKEEAAGPKDQVAATNAMVDAPDPERQARATAYLEAELIKLESYASARECDVASANAKHMLRAFPELLSERWTPAYLARIKWLSRKK